MLKSAIIITIKMSFKLLLKQIRGLNAHCRGCSTSYTPHARSHISKINKYFRLPSIKPQQIVAELIRKLMKAPTQVLSIINNQFLQKINNQSKPYPNPKHNSLPSYNSNQQISIQLRTLHLKHIDDDLSQSSIFKPQKTQSIQVQTIEPPFQTNSDGNRQPRYQLPLEDAVDSDSDGVRPFEKPQEVGNQRQTLVADRPLVEERSSQQPRRRQLNHLVEEIRSVAQIQNNRQLKFQHSSQQFLIDIEDRQRIQQFFKTYCYYYHICKYIIWGQAYRSGLTTQLKKKKRANSELEQYLDRLYHQYLGIFRTLQHTLEFEMSINMREYTSELLGDWQKIRQVSKDPEQDYVVDLIALEKQAYELCSNGVNSEFYQTLVENVRQQQPKCLMLEKQIRQLKTDIGNANSAHNCYKTRSQVMIQKYRMLQP